MSNRCVTLPPLCNLPSLRLHFPANLPDESITHMVRIAKPGVYYGYARVYPMNDRPSELPTGDFVVLPMVMSLGWNPFYKNQRMTAVCIASFRIVRYSNTCIQEIHIMHKFSSDFYGCELKALVLGYIRPELDYISRGKSYTPTARRPNINSKGTEALIDDIETDKRVSFNSLARPGYEKYASDPFFSA